MAKKNHRYDRDEEELEKAFFAMAGKRRKNKNTVGAVLVISLVIVLVLLIGFAVFLSSRQPQQEQTLGNVTVAGVNLKGMTLSQAKQALEDAAGDTYPLKSMIVKVMNTTVTLTPEITGAELDIDRAVAAAALYTGSSSFDVLPYLNLNSAAIRQALAPLGEQYNTVGAESGWELEGEVPDLSPAGLDTPCQTLVITLGTPDVYLDLEQLFRDIIAAYSRNEFEVTAHLSGGEAPVLPDVDAIWAQLHLDPVDAVMDMETFETTDEVYGYTFDLDAARLQLEGISYGTTVRIPMVRIKPEVTAESLKSVLRRDLLAIWRTPYCEDAARTENLRLACETISGTELQPGEVFSFNEALGKLTEKKGYKTAAVYPDDPSVTALGGGVSQLSSTLYRCALMADLTITERKGHTYTPSYTDRGTDAWVSEGGADLKLRNNTDYPMVIEAFLADGHVNVQLVGTDDKDYYIEIEHEIVSETPFETLYQEYPWDNPEGLKDGDVLTLPYIGYRIKTYRCKYSKETGVLLNRNYEATSTYQRRDRVVCRILPKETLPPETVPEETVTETTAP